MGPETSIFRKFFITAFPAMMVLIGWGCQGDAGIDDANSDDDASDDDDDSGADDDDSSDDDDDDITPDTDTEPVTCENYPPADGDFMVGSVVTNYQLFDKHNTVLELCEFIDGGRLMLMKLTRDKCVACQLEVEDMARLADETADQGGVVVEVHQAVATQAELDEWTLGLDFDSLRTEPPKQLEYDYRKNQLIPDFGVYLLIDLITMKVIEPNCGMVFEDGKNCLMAHL